MAVVGGLKKKKLMMQEKVNKVHDSKVNDFQGCILKSHSSAQYKEQSLSSCVCTTDRWQTDRFKNGHSLLAEPDGVEDVVMEDGLKEVIFVVCFKWWLACHHLIHQHP